MPTNFYLDLTLGVTSGYRYGHSHSAGSKPKVPTHYLRLETFSEFSSNAGLQIGFNYLGRTDEQKNETIITGIDTVAKWRKGRKLNYLFQSEAWFRSTKDINDAYTRQLGLYLFNQMGLSENLLLGLRIDSYKDLTLTNAISNQNINNITYGFSPEITWVSSEFLKLRTGLSHEFTRSEGVTTDRDTKVEFQMIFILGSHPAHSF